MKKLLSLFVMYSMICATSAQRFDWATSGGYSGVANSFLGAIDIAIDPDGNVYTMDSGNGQQICQGVTSEPYSSTTTFIYKFNPNGELLFISRVGAIQGGAFIPFNIETDVDGNLYLLGQPNGVTNAVVNDEEIVVVANTNHLIKMDPNGNLLWNRNTGFAGNGQGCMLQFSNDHIYFQSSNLGVSKMDANGDVVAVLSADYYSSPTASMGLVFKGSEVFSNGDLLFAAYSRGEVAYGTDTLFNTGNPFLTAPILLVRSSEAMELQWARYLSNARNPDQNFIPVAIDSNDDVFVSVQVNMELTIGDDTIIGDVSGIGSGTLVKVNAVGEDVWAKLIDPTGKALGWCITNSSDDSGIIVGGGYSTTIQIGTFSLPSAPNSLPFIAKFDGNGNVLNAFNYLLEPSQSGANCIEPVGNGHYMVGGKLPNATVPVFSCTPIDAAKGFYIGSFSEQPDIVPAPTISVDGSVLTASPSFEGEISWFFNGNLIEGETGQTLNVTQDGDYTVEYEYTTGCVGSSSSPVQSVTLTNVASLNSAGEISIFPNPSNGMFWITGINNGKNPVRISVRNVLGATVLSFEKYEKNLMIDMSDASQGIYFVDILIDNTISSQKIVIR